MSDLQTQISEAQKQGYSSDEIVGFLGKQRLDLAPKIKEAQENGYKPDEIIQHLAKVPEPQKDTRGFWESAIDAVNPIPSLIDYFKHGPPVAQGLNAAGEGLKELNKNPNAEIPNLPMPGGMETPLTQGVSGGMAAAGQQAIQGNPVGAMGTLAGSYGPILAASMKMPSTSKVAPTAKPVATWTGAGTMPGATFESSATTNPLRGLSTEQLKKLGLGIAKEVATPASVKKAIGIKDLFKNVFPEKEAPATVEKGAVSWKPAQEKPTPAKELTPYQRAMKSMGIDTK